MTGKALNILAKLLKKYRGEVNPVIIDIGFGEGDLALKVVNAYLEMNQKVQYHGIEYDKSFVNIVKGRFEELENFELDNKNLICGNCFSNDLDKLPNNAGLILVSHVAYYAPETSDQHTILDTKFFVEALYNKLDYSGSLVFIHESSNSDMNILRQKYCESICISANQKIKDALEQYKIPYKFIPIYSKLTFPNMESLWDKFQKDSYDGYETLESFAEAKNLLEFVVQTPLEILKERGKLHEFLLKIKQLLRDQGNILIIRTDMQIAISKEKILDLQAIDDILQEVKNAIYPNIHNLIIQTPVNQQSGYQLCYVNKKVIIIKANDTDGRIAEYYLRTNYIKEIILNKIANNNLIDLSEYGEVIYSSYIDN
ncbi:hypothetical protein NOVO_07380 [Rickettsiales bacterium Ac37b]|nr:hypothetical protein NOVO_07380 [Rickettsiales bacterium Ac37b]